MDKKVIRVSIVVFGLMLFFALSMVAFREGPKVTGFVPFSVQADGPDSGNNWNRSVVSGEVYNHRIFSSVVNYDAGLGYTLVNNSLFTSTDILYDYEVDTGYYNVFYIEDPSLGQVVRYVRNSSNLFFQPMALNYGNALSQIQQISMVQSVVGVPSQAEFVYPGMYGDGINLSYVHNALFVKEKLIVENRSVLGTPDSYIISGGDATVDFYFVFDPESKEIEVEGVNWNKNSEVTTDDAVIVKDTFGNVLYQFDRPYAYDANGSFIEINYTFDKSGPNLYVGVETPYSWLNDSSRVYPVVIDPTISISDSDIGHDVYVSDSSTSRNYGNNDYLEVDGNGERSYIQFNISSIPENVIVESAEACFFMYSDVSSQDISINHVTDDSWCEGNGGTNGNPACEITWDNQVCSTGESLSGSCESVSDDTLSNDGSLDDTWQCFNVTNMVQTDYDSLDDLLSMILWPSTGSGSDKFHSKEYSDLSLIPYLNVTYDASNLAPSISLVSPVDSGYGMETTTFSYIVSDSNLDSCELWGNFTGTYALNQTDDSPVSGSNSFSLPLSHGESYLWSVYCNDSLTNSSWSENFTFTVDGVNPLLSIIAPIGMQTSRTGIGLWFNASDENLDTCYYSVYRGGSVEIANTTVNCSSQSSFSVTLDADFVLYFYVNDSAGNIEVNTSNFTVTTTGSSSGDSGTGGSTGGGGGGGSFGESFDVLRLDVSLIKGIFVPDEERAIVVPVKNDGVRAVNKCRIKSYTASVDAPLVSNIASGEIVDFSVIVRVTDVVPELYVECLEGVHNITTAFVLYDSNVSAEIVQIELASQKIIVDYGVYYDAFFSGDLTFRVTNNDGDVLSSLDVPVDCQTPTSCFSEVTLIVPEGTAGLVNVGILVDEAVLVEDTILYGEARVRGTGFASRSINGTSVTIFTLMFVFLIGFLLIGLRIFQNMKGGNSYPVINKMPRHIPHHQKFSHDGISYDEEL